MDFIINDYLHEYVISIHKARRSPPSKNYELHHIIPISCGGSNDPHNIIALPIIEHIRLHLILPYFLKEDHKNKMIWAAMQMINTREQTENLDEALITKTKQNHKELMRTRMFGENNPNWGGHSTEAKRKMSVAHIGMKYTDDVNKKKGRRGKENGFYGRSHTKRTIEKIKQTLANKPNITCPHCGFTNNSIGNMRRYHLDNCKRKGKI